MGSGKLPADGTNSPKGFIISIFSIFCLVLPLWCRIAPAEFLLPENTPLVHIYVLQTVAHFAVPVFL